jgi:hypothetical protein
MRSIYEQQRVAKTDFLMSSGLAVEASAASSDKVGVSKYLPKENAIILESGEKIGYSQLIIAQGKHIFCTRHISKNLFLKSKSHIS